MVTANFVSLSRAFSNAKTSSRNAIRFNSWFYYILLNSIRARCRLDIALLRGAKRREHPPPKRHLSPSAPCAVLLVPRAHSPVLCGRDACGIDQGTHVSLHRGITLAALFSGSISHFPLPRLYLFRHPALPSHSSALCPYRHPSLTYRLDWSAQHTALVLSNALARALSRSKAAANSKVTRRASPKSKALYKLQTNTRASEQQHQQLALLSTAVERTQLPCLLLVRLFRFFCAKLSMFLRAARQLCVLSLYLLNCFLLPQRYL